MQQLAELDGQADRVDVQSSRRRKTVARRKVTVRLSERVSGRLDVASDRPGVGKSMLVEAALEQFMNPAPSVEAVLREQLDHVHARFDHLERDMRMIAETVTLHARYHLTVVPPLPEARQREAVALGDERFKILAEQVDRRVRQSRPLMQETIDRLNSAGHEKSGPTAGEGPADSSKPGRNNTSSISKDVHSEQTPAAPARTGNVIPNFLRHPKEASGEAAKSASHTGQSQRVAESANPVSSDEKSGGAQEHPLARWRLIISVFLPFATGYFLSFLFRTINASISPVLASDFGLGAAETGLLASVYFLVFAGAQIPIGVLLDRYGPRRVQGVLLVLAVGGASLFGNADSFAELLVGRALIGLGVAASLMAGLKAIVMWFPRDRVALVNGGMIMLGSLGAVTATAPTDWLLAWIGWRSLFEVLTILTLAVAALIYFVTPKEGSFKRSTPSEKALSLRSIFSDPRFLRIAPLSATCIGSSWAMHSLWAASWLSDVEELGRQSVINQLFAMAMGISMGALLLGTIADRLRKRGIATEVLLVVVSVLFMLAELAIILRLPLPSILPWSIVSVVGAGTVLSYAIIADYFPVEIAARANGALNLLHFGCAFAVQYGIGLIVASWVPEAGHYPLVAYQAAFGLTLLLQAVALVWFAVPWLRDFFRLVHSSAEGADDEITFVRPAAEALVLDGSQGIEW
jgi:MFS family permease